MSSNGYHSNNGGAADAGDMQAMLQKSVTQSIEAMGKHDYKDGEDTTKLFGLFEVDSGIVSGFNMLYTSFGTQISRYLSPKVYDSVIKFGPGIKKITGHALSETTLNRTAAGVTLGVNLGAFLMPSVSQFTQDVIQQHDDRETLRRRIAPVLDEVYGSHSIGTYMAIPPQSHGNKQGNTVIYAHRRRMNHENLTKNWNTVLSAVGKNLLNVLGEGISFEALRTGVHRDEIFNQKHHDLSKKIREDVEKENTDKKYNWSPQTIERRVRERADKEVGAGNFLAFAGGGAILSQLADALAASSKRKLERRRQPYSALEMILALEQQVQDNPGGATRFALPGRKGRELSVEDYVTEIFEQHQKEMADFDPHYTEIRAALKDDLKLVTKPIADAIKRGDMNPQMLIRLVGEGHVVKKQGRGLASSEDVETMLERFVSRSHTFNVADPKEYIEERNFTLEHVKEALHVLQGEERFDFAATIPDPVLRAAGMDDKDIKETQMHRATAAHDLFLMYEALGVASKTDKELQDAGLGSAQIKRLHKDADLLRHDGEAAIKQLKSGPANADGVEHIVNDFAVPKIAGDKDYLGKLIASGKEALTNKDADKGEHKTHVEKHAKKPARADDEDMDFAERELERDEHEHDGHGATRH